MKTQEDKYLTGEDVAFIVDDHLLFAESFASLLKSMRLFKHVLQCNNEEDMISSLKTKHFTHLFLDYNISGLNTITLLKVIRKINPAMHIIIISSTDNIFLVHRMINSDADAFITKQSNTTEIDLCINAIKMGRVYIAKTLKYLLQDKTEKFQPLHFTAKEIQVLQFIAKGYTIGETASALCLSKHTIVAHRRKMMNKSRSSTATGLVKFAFEAGLIDLQY